MLFHLLPSITPSSVLSQFLWYKVCLSASSLSQQEILTLSPNYFTQMNNQNLEQSNKQSSLFRIKTISVGYN